MKYRRGDRVKIKDTMPSYMSHFECGCEAILVDTYHAQFGGGDRTSWTVLIPNEAMYALYGLPCPEKEKGKWHNVSWYDNDQFEKLISRNTPENRRLLEKLRHD